MSNQFYGIAIDCADAAAVATFWAEVLGREIDDDAGGAHKERSMTDVRSQLTPGPDHRPSDRQHHWLTTVLPTSALGALLGIVLIGPQRSRVAST